MIKRTLAVIMALTLCGVVFFGCKKAEETKAPETQTETETKETETEKETEKETRAALPEGMMYSYLTGEPVDTAIGTKRPFAIMINNIQEAIPQSGISQAEIVYECPVEYGITRLMCLFQDISGLDKVGSVRSARHYYVDLSNDNDAIYVHFGWSPFAEERITADGIPSVNGLYDDGTVFYRTDDREAPHNVYTNKEGLEASLSWTGQTRDYPEGYESRLVFNPEDTVPENGQDASKVTLPFSANSPWFEYDAETGLYDRFQFGEAHIDVENGEQLTFKNLVIQYADRSVISEQDHQDFSLYGEGKGLYISDGKAVEITWKKADKNDKTRYYYADGTEVSLNPGKSYMALVPSDTSVTLE